VEKNTPLTPLKRGTIRTPLRDSVTIEIGTGSSKREKNTPLTSRFYRDRLSQEGNKTHPLTREVVIILKAQADAQ